MPTVLIVDDSQAFCNAMAVVFQAEGFKIITASDARKAFRHLDDTCVDLVLLDMGLPGSDGLDFLRTLRAEPGLRSLPVIVVTGGGDLERIGLLHQFHVHKCLVKSRFGLRELMDEVWKAIEHARMPLRRSA